MFDPVTLTLDSLGCARGGLAVLEGISLRLEPGQARVLRGPNGIGKTTLLRAIAGLGQITGGRVSPGSEACAYAGHADGLKAPLTLEENLKFWAQLHGGAEIAPALDAFNLRELVQRRASDLSAGQKRRLGLARLMVTGRPVWLLDEPTVSLDRASVDLFARSVERHLAQGGSALIATHIDLGLEAEDLDLAPFRAQPPDLLDWDEAL